MQLDKGTLDALLEYLLNHGYPKSSFAIEYNTGRYRIDLAILDPKTNLPIQIFEIKSKKNNDLIKMGKEQLKKYLNELKLIDVPAYLVFPSVNEPYFEVERITIDEQSNIDSESIEGYNILNFNMQKQTRVIEKIEKTKIDKDKARDSFKIVCWILSALLVLLLIIQKTSLISLDTIDISILGAAIGLFIIPFANKLKILGIEFERFQREKSTD